MPDYAWPDAQHRTLIGARITRVDARAKVSGQANYTYDVHRTGMLYGKGLHSGDAGRLSHLPHPEIPPGRLHLATLVCATSVDRDATPIFLKPDPHGVA